MKGWIKIPRDILDEELFKNPNMLSVFVNLLMRASWSDHEHEGVQYKEGQVVTSIRQIGEWCGLSIQNVRTVLANMKLIPFITFRSTHISTIITICDYGSYKFDVSETQQVNNKATNIVANKHIIEKLNRKENKKKINKRKNEENSITKLIEREHNRVLDKSKKVESEVNRIEDMIKFVEENPNSTALGVLKNLKTSGRLKELGITWQEKN